MFDDVIIRADIIVRVEGGWDLYEVKSASEVTGAFLNDVSIQRYVMDGAGLKVRSANLVHINTESARRGEVDVYELFKVADVTGKVESLTGGISAVLDSQKKTLESSSVPTVFIGEHCRKPYECDFKGHCWAHVPENSVFDLANARYDKKFSLWEGGVKLVRDIPAGTKLSAPQALQVQAARTGKAFVDIASITGHLRGLQWPRYHLDFETFNAAIPPYAGMRPFQQLPFEASVHIQDAPGAPIRHEEYICDGSKDPRNDMIVFLVNTIGPIGSVIAYNKSFEGGCLKDLADITLGQSSARLLSIVDRLWDLATPFRKAHYVHPDFKGSWSIKNILPVLVPGMGYEGLAIKDGAAAMAAYSRLVKEAMTPEQRAQIMADLKTYCGQDTMAMVKLLEHLEQTVGVAA
jgi:hypothetical protein